MQEGVFLSYRRADEPAFAGRIFDRLEDALPGRVFMDVDRVAPGTVFRDVLERELRQCGVFLAIIGPQWIDVADEHGHRRLESPDDWVRMEIELAMQTGAAIVPVLVQDATVPSQDQLPPTLHTLFDHNVARVGHARFQADVEGLIRSIRERLAERAGGTANDVDWSPLAVGRTLIFYPEAASALRPNATELAKRLRSEDVDVQVHRVETRGLPEVDMRQGDVLLWVCSRPRRRGRDDYSGVTTQIADEARTRGMGVAAIGFDAQALVHVPVAFKRSRKFLLYKDLRRLRDWLKGTVRPAQDAPTDEVPRERGRAAERAARNAEVLRRRDPPPMLAGGPEAPLLLGAGLLITLAIVWAIMGLPSLPGAKTPPSNRLWLVSAHVDERPPALDELAGVLDETFGFHPHEFDGARRATVLRQLTRIGTSAHSSPVLVYLSGRSECDEAGVWFPADGVGIPHLDIVEGLAPSVARQVVLIADDCFVAPPAGSPGPRERGGLWIIAPEAAVAPGDFASALVETLEAVERPGMPVIKLVSALQERLQTRTPDATIARTFVTSASARPGKLRLRRLEGGDAE